MGTSEAVLTGLRFAASLRLATVAGLLLACAPGAAQSPAVPRLQLERIVDGQTGLACERGTLTVWEDREAKAGRTLELPVVVLRALGDAPAPDPVFIFQGGPGLGAARGWRRYADHWMRQDRDIVLLSQRGTDGANRLDCAAPGGAGDLQGYLEPVFGNEDAFRACLDALGERADLRFYGTATAMADLDDLRRAIGCTTINVMGGSYGSRAALEYVRCYGAHVRSAIVTGVAPVEFVNPLYHASAAQSAIELIFDECAADPECSAAYPDLPGKLAATLERLEREPARVELANAVTGEPIEFRLSRDAFAEALRMLMYYDSRRIPYLVESAFAGDYRTFVRAGFQSNRAVRDQVAFGMLLCVTCGEDVPRIDADRIDELTEGTFLGDIRVRQQMEVCALWPESDVPADHGQPLCTEVPILLLSGIYDPVTPPAFAEELARRLPNALHVVAPGSHGVGGPCIDEIMRQFLEGGSVEDIDTTCVKGMSVGGFHVES